MGLSTTSFESSGTSVTDEFRHAITLGALIAVNAIPLLGVLFWQWDVGSIIVLYWSENLVLGAFTILKMIHKSGLGGLFYSAFFTVHYGGFCAVHGVFVLAMTQGDPSGDVLGDVLDGFNPQWFGPFIFVELLLEVVGYVLSIAPPEWILGFVSLFASHGLSLWMNYFQAGEYRNQTARSLMSAPYKRIVVLHVAIIAGGFGVVALGSPLPMLLLLVVLKTGLDVWLHLRERQAQKALSTSSD